MWFDRLPVNWFWHNWERVHADKTEIPQGVRKCLKFWKQWFTGFLGKALHILKFSVSNISVRVCVCVQHDTYVIWTQQHGKTKYALKSKNVATNYERAVRQAGASYRYACGHQAASVRYRIKDYFVYHFDWIVLIMYHRGLLGFDTMKSCRCLPTVEGTWCLQLHCRRQ
jgi:hypothetical protein